MQLPDIPRHGHIARCQAAARAIESAENSKSPNTRRSYRTALLQYAAFMGLLPGHWRALTNRIQREDEAIARAIPAAPDDVFRWVGHLDLQGLKPSSIATRLAAIASAHKERRIPLDLTLAQRALAGIRREKGSARRMASPLRVDELKRMLPDGADLRSKRDRALLLLGWSTALRRSELVGLDVMRDVSTGATGWIEITSEGLKVHLLQSKTDALGEGDSVAVPRTDTPFCPVSAVEAWIAAAGFCIGPLLRPIARGDQAQRQRLTVDGIAHIIKRRAVSAGLGARSGETVHAPNGMPITSHSLRAGFVTECARQGVELNVIQQISRHKDLKVLAGYIREQNKFATAPHARLGL
jgi:integrase